MRTRDLYMTSSLSTRVASRSSYAVLTVSSSEVCCRTSKYSELLLSLPKRLLPKLADSEMSVGKSWRHVGTVSGSEWAELSFLSPADTLYLASFPDLSEVRHWVGGAFLSLSCWHVISRVFSRFVRGTWLSGRRFHFSPLLTRYTSRLFFNLSEVRHWAGGAFLYLSCWHVIHHVYFLIC